LEQKTGKRKPVVIIIVLHYKATLLLYLVYC
jgi:hypothetical protein